MNVYAYAGGDPISFNDPTGENPAIAIARAGRIGWQIGQEVSLGIETSTGLPLGVHIYDWVHREQQVDWDKVQKQLDNDNYHRVCDRKAPPGLNPCEDARWRYRQALKCQRLRQEWEQRWGTKQSAGPHSRGLNNVKQRLKNAASDIANFCGPPCP